MPDRPSQPPSSPSEQEQGQAPPPTNTVVTFDPHDTCIKSGIKPEEEEEEDIVMTNKKMAIAKQEPEYGFLRDFLRGSQIRLVVLLESLLWCLLLLPFAAAVGIVCGLFLWALEWCTLARFDNPWIIYLCPVGGMIVAGSYHLFAGASSKGNNLVIDAVRKVSHRGEGSGGEGRQPPARSKYFGLCLCCCALLRLVCAGAKVFMCLEVVNRDIHFCPARPLRNRGPHSGIAFVSFLSSRLHLFLKLFEPPVHIFPFLLTTGHTITGAKQSHSGGNSEGGSNRVP